MLTPIRDHIVVSVIKTEEKAPGSLIIRPGNIDERIVEGKVLSVGSGYLTDSGTVVPLEVKEGNTILLNKQLCVEVSHKGETYYILREEQVLSVIS